MIMLADPGNVIVVSNANPDKLEKTAPKCFARAHDRQAPADLASSPCSIINNIQVGCDCEFGHQSMLC